MCEIPIESMKRMRLKKGDAVVLKTSEMLSMDATERLKTTMIDSLKKMGFNKDEIDTPVFILEEGMDIEILSKGTEKIKVNIELDDKKLKEQIERIADNIRVRAEKRSLTPNQLY